MDPTTQHDPASASAAQTTQGPHLPQGQIADLSAGPLAVTESTPAAWAALEAQVREAFGRVAYSHKTHEKCADIELSRLARIKIAQIVLSAVTTGGLLVVVFGDADASRITAVVTAVISTALLAMNAYTKENDPGRVAQQHKEAADQLWAIRESYVSLLVDLRDSVETPARARERRDELQKLLGEVYRGAPRTSSKGYDAASKALKVREDLTFSDEEIDQFLPEALKKRSSRAP